MGKIFIITGPSGAGKTTIAEHLEQKYNFHRPKTITTRAKREGEASEAYVFTSKEAFLEEVRGNSMAEYVEYGENFYGSLTASYDRKEHVVVVLEHRGCLAIKNLFGQKCITICLTAGHEDLIQRIETRSSINKEELECRKKEFAEYINISAEHHLDTSASIETVKRRIDRIIALELNA